MIIEIWTKEKYARNEEAAFIARLAHAGLKVKAARLSRLYKVDADFSKEEFEKIASELLTDNITEHYSLSPGKAGLKDAYRAEVWLKDSVTDVVGESVKEAVADVAGKLPEAVRFGHAYYVPCDSEQKLKHAVTKTLVNEIVNKFKIEKC
ncbi:MAG: phosphoribosylformylglycinamidine synthase subunit PurS [Elusimicrobiota bacterium]|nr:phosphoribosylformylglycinamidine synthase subunit PurS [Elusimicrobiota bacterium]